LNWTILILKIVEMVLKYLLSQEDSSALVKEKIGKLVNNDKL